ncbi:MAG: DUF3098 domain-containing protein [Salinivirgaceae bacterium]|jgi:hypothetical protein|nr:DUF3098 domain-containing protein [Salinivirgaceae bacterium]
MAEKETKKLSFAIPKESYKHLLIGFGIVIAGYLLMMGGGADNPENFSQEIFSFRRITLAPVTVIAGFAYIMWAIMRKPKKEE